MVEVAVSQRRTNKGSPMITLSSRPLVPLSACPLVTLSCLLLAAGCELPGKPKPADRPVPPDQEVRFEKLFKQNCAGCHGTNGELGPAPPLNDPLFRAIVPEKELESVLNRGRRGTPMPAFARENGGVLTVAQIQVLVNEIKGIPYKINKEGKGETAKIEVVRAAEGDAPRWGSPAQSVEGVPPYRTPEVKPGGAGAGREKPGAKVFARACAGCHGDEGRGGKEGAINNTAFLNLISAQALRRLVITGRPDLGMPRYDQNAGRLDFTELTSQEIADVVELLADWRQGGSGNSK